MQGTAGGRNQSGIWTWSMLQALNPEIVERPARAGVGKQSDSEWDSDLVMPWDEDSSPEAHVQLAAVAVDWIIQRSEIQICKHPDGSDWLLGHTATGKVLYPKSATQPNTWGFPHSIALLYPKTLGDSDCLLGHSTTGRCATKYNGGMPADGECVVAQS